MGISTLKGKTYQRRKPVIGMFILLAAFVISFLIPIVAPVISVALIAGGVTLYRQTTEGTIRTIAVAAIVGGIVIILLYILMMLFLFSTGTISFGTEGILTSEINSTMTIPEAKFKS